MARVFWGGGAVLQIRLREFRALFVANFKIFKVNMTIAVLKPILTPPQMGTPENPNLGVKNNVIWR